MCFVFFVPLTKSQTKITNLTKGTLYEVKVQGATRSMKESSKLYRGDFSEPRKVILQSKCISKWLYSFLFPTNRFSNIARSLSYLWGTFCFHYSLSLSIPHNYW